MSVGVKRASNKQTVDANDDFSNYIDRTSSVQNFPTNATTTATTTPTTKNSSSNNNNSNNNNNNNNMPNADYNKEHYDSSYQVKKHFIGKKKWKTISKLLMLTSAVMFAVVIYFIASKMTQSANKRVCTIDCDKEDLSDYSFLQEPHLTPTSSNHNNHNRPRQKTQSQTYTPPQATHLLLPPSSFHYLAFHVDLASPVHFIVLPQKNSNIGVYGKKSENPSHLVYDFFHPIKGVNELERDIDENERADRKKRQVKKKKKAIRSDNDDENKLAELKDTQFVEYLTYGVWHVGLFNDDTLSFTNVSFQAVMLDKNHFTSSCPQMCTKRGLCGSSSSSSSSSSGSSSSSYSGGSSSSDGCKCFTGYQGAACNESIDDNDCGNSRTCSFSPNCIHKETCNNRCFNGDCVDGACKCREGFAGKFCEVAECSPLCFEHGKCRNGTCICDVGWNGRLCQLEGCPNGCHPGGKCVQKSKYEITEQDVDDDNDEGYLVWLCECRMRSGFYGCADEEAEMTCNDGIDDDNDGLIDCLDSDCLIDTVCQHSIKFRTVDPVDLSIKRSYFTDLVSFYERFRFLFDNQDFHVQSDHAFFSEKLVSLIRGQVLTNHDTVVYDLRIYVKNQPSNGHTLSDKDGFFDIIVNGGGTVTLILQAANFTPKEINVYVPTNRRITLGTIYLYPQNAKTDFGSVPSDKPKCPGVFHDYVYLRPVIYSPSANAHEGYKGFQGSALFPETSSIQESIEIPGTDIRLLYHSKNSLIHLSYVTILLIGDVIPRDLVLVHLAISVESNYLKKTLNAKRNLYYTYNWDKQDKYQQKIYGVSTVKVSVGYEYLGCSEIFWTVSTGRMAAYSWNPMDFHKWRVNVLHAYDSSGGILHRGDGSMFLFRDQPPHITTYIGDGSIRKHECKRCVETISECRLIAPVDIVEGTDGSLYMADYNFVRKISPENNSVTNVLQLNITDVSYKYYLAVNPLDGSVFVSNYKNYRILRIKNTSSFNDAAKNFEVYVGTGEPCIPGDKELCGDNGPAIQAKLFFPKGIAINKDGVLYIADGKNVRMVNGEGIITTVVGTPKLPGPFIPFPCSGVSMASDVMLQWPTSLSINHLDESLHILDTGIIYRLTQESRLHVVAGHLSHCLPQMSKSKFTKNLRSTDYRFEHHHHNEEPITFTFAPIPNNRSVQNSASKKNAINGETSACLLNARHISISNDGEIFVVLSNGKDVNRIVKIDSDGKLQHIAGLQKGGCDCQRQDCSCNDLKKTLASVTPLNSPSSLTVTQDGTIFVADTGNNRIRIVKPQLPERNNLGEYVIKDGDLIYVFSSDAHSETIDAKTNKTIYTFVTKSYDLDSLVIHENMHSLIEFKKSESRINITVNGTQKHTFVAFEGRIKSYQRHDGVQDSFTFDNDLLRSVINGDGTIKIYEYDKRHRISSFVNTAGVRKHLKSELVLGSKERNGLMVEIRDEKDIVEDGFLIGKNSISVYSGGKFQRTIEQDSEEQSISIHFLSGTRILFSNYTDDSSVHVEKRIVTFPDGKRVENTWRITNKYSSSGNLAKVTKEFKIANRLLFQHEQEDRSETIFNSNQKRILHLIYDQYGNLVRIQPSEQISETRFFYNPQGSRLLGWERSNNTVRNIYDNGHLTRLVNGAQFKKYIYKGNKLHEILTPSGKPYRYHYDSHGLIKGVTTPSNNSFYFHGLQSFNTYRQILKTDIGIYSRSFDPLGRPLLVLLPSNHRRVTYHYSRHGNRVSVFTDLADYVYDFDPHFKGNLRWANVTDRVGLDFHCSIGFNSRDSFITSQTVSFSGEARAKSNLSNTRYRYYYDEFGRITHTNISIAELDYQSNMEFSFCNITGSLEGSKPFTFQRLATSSPELIITSKLNDQIELLKIFDSLTRLKEMYLRLIASQILYHLKIDYNETSGKLKKTTTKIGPGKIKEQEYIYDSDGNLLEVAGPNIWKYGYDNNGNIAKIITYKTVEQVIMNRKEQIESVGEEVYYYDGDGFLSKRGREIFEFDPTGKLKRTHLSDKYDVRYYYDSRHRLVARHELISGSKVQFLYSDLNRRDRITHAIDTLDAIPTGKSNIRITQFYYAPDGVLFALKRNSARSGGGSSRGDDGDDDGGEEKEDDDDDDDDSNYSFIVTDAFNSPTAVIKSGIIIKEMEYTPMGAKTRDTADDVIIHHGFRGGIWDPWTKFVFFESGRKVYDTKIGRLVVPEYPNIPDRVEGLFGNPEIHAHPYKITFPGDNKLMEIMANEDGIMDTKSILSQMGYSVDNIITPTSKFASSWAFEDLKHLLPQQNRQKTCEYTPDRIPDIVLQPKISLQCAFDSQSARFSRLISRGLNDRSRNRKIHRISSHLPFFGKGILITSTPKSLTEGDPQPDSNEQNFDDFVSEADVNIFPIADYALSNLSSTLLNGTKRLQHRYQARSKDVQHFVQEDFYKAQQDIAYLNLRETGIIKGLNVTVHKNESSRHAEVRLLSNHTIVYLKYGLEPAIEIEKILKHAKSRALEEAWEIERELSRNQKLSVSIWTKEQREELKISGKVSGVQAKFIRNVQIFPELVDDPRNIIFVTEE